MRTDAPGSLLTARLREPRHVVAIIYPTGSLYFTSKLGMTNVPGQVTQGVLEDISSVSQQFYPDEGRSTIGAMSFSVVDVAGAVTELIRSQLQTFDYGIREREVRVFTGDSDDFNLLTRVETYVIDSVVELRESAYRFSCSDRNREMRDDIFEQVGSRLTSSYTPGDSVLNVQSTAGFELLAHTAAFTDAPSSTVGYIRLRKTGEVLRYTAKTDSSFTGCVGERFGTIAQEIVVDPATDADRLPEVEEFIYLEMPGPQLLYAVQTGTVLGTGISLPEHWHLGIAASSINDALYSAVSTDLFDPNDHSKGLILRFTHLEKTDGKRFCEKQLHVPMMTWGPIDALGRIGLRRVVPLLSSAAPVAVLDETNVISYGAVVHNQARVINEVVFDWNFNGEEYTRPDIFFNVDSIIRFGRGNRREYELAGLYVSRHSRATIQRIMDSLTDRYGAPPIEQDLHLSATMNALEIGDVVLLQLPEIRDYAGSGTLNRAFEIQSISRNWVTGDFSVRVFGSTARISPEVDANLGSVLSDAWLLGTGTALSSVLTMTGDHVTANGNLAAGVYFHDGDVIVDGGVTVTINGNVQIRHTGELAMNGKIDGKGRGLAAIADTNVIGNPAVFGIGGAVQTFGSTRGSAGINFQSGAGGVFYGSQAAPVQNGAPATPRFALATVSGELLGLPAELRGSPGMFGAPTTEGVTRIVRALGGVGGAGGAGLALIGRGLSFGAAGEIDLSGNNGSAPGGSVVLGGRTLIAGAGGGGSSGSLLVVLDGDDLPMPDLTDGLVVMHGATPQTGSPIGQIPPDDPPSEPWTGRDPGIGAIDLFEGAQVIQYAPQDLTLASTDDEIVPAPASLVADDDGVSVQLTWAPPPEALYDYVEIWESINNDRVNAVRVAQVRGDTWETASDATLTRYYWVRAHKIGRGVSAWEPESSLAGVPATFGGAVPPALLGAALNSNPFFSTQDGTPSLEGWDWPDGEATLLNDGQVGRTAGQIVGMNAQRILMSDLVPIDLAEQYRLSVWLRQPAGGLHSYLLVSCFDAAGNALDGGTFPGVGWSTGTFHYWGLVDALIPASFTHYSTTFGPNTERQLPSQTRYIKIGGLFPYVTGTVGPSTIQVQAYLLVKLTTQVFRQSAAPAHVAGRLWQDTDDGRIYRSDGSSWVQITAADALLLVNAPAQAGADVTALNADDIIFRQAAAPSSAQIGWLWLDTDDLRFYRYNGAFWVQIGSDDARNLSAGAPAEAGADATAGHADDIIFRQSTAPAGAQVGWLWIDTDDLRVYRFNGSIWVQIGSNDVQGLDNVGDLASEDSVDTVHIDLEAATEVVQTTDASTVASANNASVLSETSPASIVVDEDTDVYEVVGQGLSQVTTSGGPGSPEANLLLRYQLNGGGYVNPMGGGFIGRTMNTIVPFMLTGVVTGFDPGDDVDFAVQVAAAEIGGGGTVTHTVTNATIVVTKVKR